MHDKASSAVRTVTHGRALASPLLAVAVFGLIASPATPLSARSERQPYYTGVNLSGGEFASRKVPGVRGRDYGYPKASDFAPFAQMGMNAVRVPVLWQRIQPVPKGPLADDEMAALDAALAPLEKSAVLVILDIHNYASFAGRKLGTDPGLDGALPDLWTRLAARYAEHSRVAFGLMNEPHGVDAVVWRGIVDATVAGIRGTGARNLILVPGTRWSGAHSWTNGDATSNAAAFAGFRDPGGNMLFEMHQYLDRNSSGTGADCVSGAEAARRIAAATRWLHEQKQRGFLGEFSAPSTPDCAAALDALLTAVDSDRVAWAGWTAWGAGSWWSPRYAMAIQPRDGVAPGQLVVLRVHAARADR